MTSQPRSLCPETLFGPISRHSAESLYLAARGDLPILPQLNHLVGRGSEGPRESLSENSGH